MVKLPADVDLGKSDGGGARKERESGGDCFDSSDALSLSKSNNIKYHTLNNLHKHPGEHNGVSARN